MSEWKEYKLGEIASFKTGKLNSNAAVANGLYPFFTCSPETLRINDFAFDQEAVLLAGNNAEGNFNIKYYAGKFNAYQRTYIISGNDGVDNKFLYYALSICLKHFKAFSQGTATKFLTAVILNNFRIIIPESLLIQRRIASILSSLDDKITVNKKICENLEAQAQALFKSWFVDFEPFKDGVFMESEIGMIPSGWEYKSILGNEYFRLCKSKVLPFIGEKKYYATANVDGKDLCGTPDVVTYDNRPSRADVVPRKNSIWFARMSKSYKILNCFGASNWLADEAIISTGFCGITTELEFYGFVYTYLISDTFDRLKDLYATGTTQISLTNQGLSNIKVLLPPKSEIVKFSKIVQPLLEKIEICKNENFKLSETRDILLPKLMSGQIKL